MREIRRYGHRYSDTSARRTKIFFLSRCSPQLGLYYAALDRDQDAVDAFQKALFICPDDISATVHLCRLYLSPSSEVGISSKNRAKRVDLAAGLLSHLTRGAGWDSPEAWYYLAKACGLQGRKEKER